MLFRPQAQLASSLVLGWFSACVAWCSSCLPGPSLQPQVCVFSPPLVLAKVLFLRCLLSPSGFLLSLVSKFKVACSRRS